MRLQVLGQIPDARREKRDLDLGRTRVLVGAFVLRDELAFDFSLYCQNSTLKYTCAPARAVRTRIPRSRPNADRRPRAMRRAHRPRSRARVRTGGVSQASARLSGPNATRPPRRGNPPRPIPSRRPRAPGSWA